MPFSARRGRPTPLILASCLPLLAGCAGTVPMPVILSALNCAPLIPQSYRQPVPPAALPSPTIGAIAAALDQQTGQLELANARTSDVIAITEACDKRAAEVQAALAPKRRFWLF